MTVTRHTLFALPVALLTVLAGVAAAQTTPASGPADLYALSREASTTQEHADLATRFRHHAESLDARAVEAEARVKKLVATAPPFAHKWPANRMLGVREARREAVEARRAAGESREMAAQHARLAVESLSHVDFAAN